MRKSLTRTSRSAPNLRRRRRGRASPGAARLARSTTLQRGGSIDPAKVLALIERRDAARQTRDFSTADALLDELAGLGVSVDDARRQKRWWLGKRADEPASSNERDSKANPRGAADASRRAWYNNPPQD